MKFSSRRLLREFSFGVALLALLAAVGCGYGSGSSVRLPHTIGNYSASTLNGTYVYEIHGSSSLSGNPYREVGVFKADGAGNITAGTDDSSFSGGLLVSFTGSYQIGSDGTGSATFNSTTFGQPVTFAITVVSSSKVDLMEADAFVDGAGVADLQNSSAAGSTPSGTFVFRLHETISAQSQASESEVGAVTVSGGAVVPGDRVDQNLGGTSSLMTIAGGSFGTPAAMGRGTATITDSTNFSTTLVYYIVDSANLVLLVSNANAVGSGRAEAQTGAVGNGLSGAYAFGSRGDDGTFLDGVASVGSFNASSGVINSFMFDSMQDGSHTNATTSGTYTISSDGRVAVMLNSGASEVFWMVSPARAFFLVSSTSKVEDGTADLQTSGSLSPSTTGQYALVMDGIDLNFGQILARIGPLQFNQSGKLALTELVNASSSGQGATGPNVLSGTYSVSNGRITGDLNNGSLDPVMYAVSGSEAYALQIDPGTNTSGTVSLQH